MSNLRPIDCKKGCASISTFSLGLNGTNDKEQLTAQEDNTCPQKVQSTPEIEKKYVHYVYDAIAPHFSSTRYAKWPKVAGFLNSLTPGSVVLDAGCGNGKYLGFNPDCFFIGCDISPSLIDICASRGNEVLVADAVNIPYRDNFGDAAISIAVLHHLSTEMRRRKAIEELVRVVRKGGFVLITVWAVEQEDASLLTKWTPLFNKYDDEWVSPASPRLRNTPEIKLESIPEAGDNSNKDMQTILKADQESCFEEELATDIEATDLFASNVGESSVSSLAAKGTQQEYFVPWHLPYHRAEVGGASVAAVESGLAKKDDKKGAMVYSRYYHVFVEGELQSLVSGIDSATIVDQFYDKSNWCLVLQKI